jgi:hypothetical protein
VDRAFAVESEELTLDYLLAARRAFPLLQLAHGLLAMWILIVRLLACL